MLWKYTLAAVLLLGFLTFLKFVQDSPIRSWKAVFLTALPLVVVLSLWIKWAYPPSPPPQPKTERVEINRAELERTLRRIEGVDRATIQSNRIELNFGVERSIDEVKRLARNTAGNASFFLKIGETRHLTVLISVLGRKRYEMQYNPNAGVLSETTF